MVPAGGTPGTGPFQAVLWCFSGGVTLCL